MCVCVANTVMKLQISQNTGNFVILWATISLIIFYLMFSYEVHKETDVGIMPSIKSTESASWTVTCFYAYLNNEHNAEVVCICQSTCPTSESTSEILMIF